MTLLQSAAALLSRQPRAAAGGGLENPALPLTSGTLADWLVGPATSAGVPVTETSCYGMPAVWRAVSMISGVGGGLPLHVYSQKGSARVPIDSGPEADLIDKPHPDMTPFELWELGYASVATWGNAAYRKVYDGAGRLRELWWLEPSRVKYGRASDGTKVYTIDGNTDDALGDRAILHVPGFGYDGVCGASPIRMAREGISLALAAEKYGAKLFGSGSLHTGILQTEQRIDQATADALKKRWRAGGSGLDSAHDVRVLGSGTKFQPLSIPPADAQFIESRRFQISEVARIYGLPPHLLAETDRSTSWGSGIEEQNIALVVYTLRSWFQRFEQRISTLFIPKIYTRYALGGLLRGNSAAQAAWYKEMWMLGALSTNEIRAYEELPPVPGGDVRYRPLNMGVLGQADPAKDPATATTAAAMAALLGGPHA